MSPAQSYAAITREVNAIVQRHAENDRERACYMVARAALLVIRADKGAKVAAEKAFGLGDELAVEGMAD